MACLSSVVTKTYLLASFFSIAFMTSTAATQRRQELLAKSLKTLQLSDSVIHFHKPIRTTRSGEFIDVATIDALSHVAESGKLRRRRFVEPRNVREKLDASSATEDGNHVVFFDLGHVAGSPLSGARLHLKRNYKLVSENFMVEERSRGGKINRRHSLIHECHYTGVIHNHDRFSKVALSLCNGLQGIILKDEDTFFIEPLWNYTKENKSNQFSTTSSPINEVSDETESHPHVIVKRSALEHLGSRRKNKNDLGHCGYSDKVRGNVPWWRIDPRDKDHLSQEKNSRDSKTSDDSRDENGHSHERNRRRNRLFNHRSNSGREAHSSNGQSSGRSKRSADELARSRTKRSVSRDRNVETMVVADKMLVGYHGRREVEKYILTIMNMVSSLYHDASIGNAVNVVVTRIVLLTEDQPNLQISHHADKSLDSFCKWQRGINANGTNEATDSGLAHHDNAVLMTGFDICTFKDEPCGTLGLAPVAGMCESERSCNINEDTGLSSAFTIAHEIGHNFGMQHDGTGNSCGPDSGAPSQIMAPQLTKNTSPFTWSGCSKKYITSFLDSGAGKCLLDAPPMRYFNFPEDMPGQMHDAEEQCRFQYGPQSRQCKIGNICRELWCLSKNGRCITNSVPAAEGTSCSTDSFESGWCYRGNCVRFGYRPEAVDGGWGDWTTWADCSRTCGSGVSTSTRICDSPIPEHGGKYCIGERRRHRICNPQPCPPSSRDYRHEQCATFDNEPFRGKYYNWLPFVGGHGSKPCALNCLAQGYNFYTERAAAVVDGTRCTANSLDICISGECHHVGCDNVLHSDAIEDKCRVCGGDGSTCQTETGIFNQPVLHGRYHDVITIPRGSVNIFIEELEVSMQNYIAMRSARGRNYINGAWTIDWPRKFEIAGTTFNYLRSTGEPETLQALGPIDEDLVVMVLLQEPNRGIRYEYNVPVEREGSGRTSESAFLWDHDEWTPCSASCASGIQRRPIICRRVDDDTVVQHSYCDRSTMPVERQQTCNQEPCPAGWNIGEWLECSRTCGGGRRTRSVVCMRKLTQTETEIVSNRLCQSARPDRTEPCNSRSCPAVWISHPWSPCTTSCGGGIKTRRVSCVSPDRRLRYNETACDPKLEPSVTVRCNQRPCRRSVWKAKRWSACSGECGGRGTKRRRVVCVYHRTSIQSKECRSSNKPKSIMSCESPCSQPGGWNSLPDQCMDDPKVHYCPLVKRFKFCRRSYFRKMCCQTCSRR